MNPLQQTLPTAVLVGGSAHPVRWHWRDCMRIILAWEDSGLTPAEQQQLTLELLYPQPPEAEHRVQALQQAVRFLNAGEQHDSHQAGGGEGGRLYSFAKDGRYIYPAFRSCHGIDLAVAGLHWWEFCWLFMELGEDCTFCRLVALRSRRRQGKLTPQERQQIAQLEDLLELPQQYTPGEQQSINRFLAAMGARG